MKYVYFITLYFISTCTVFAQNQDSVRSIVLSDVVISAKKSENGAYAKKIKSFNSHYIISPLMKKDGYEVYLTTYCAPLNPLPIKLYSIELKLAPYDTSLFAIKGIVMQVKSSGDTIFQTFDINGSEIQKKKMVVDVKHLNIILHPTNFYIGYAFIPTNKLTGKYDYRIYQNDNGIGAAITVINNKAHIGNIGGFNYNFPFKISYITL